MIKSKTCNVTILTIRAVYNISSALISIAAVVSLFSSTSKTVIPAMCLLLFLELTPHLFLYHNKEYLQKVSTTPKLIAEHKMLIAALTYSFCLIKLVLSIYMIIENRDRLFLLQILYKWLTAHSAIGFGIHLLYNYTNLEKKSLPSYDDDTNKLIRLHVVAFCTLTSIIGCALLILVIVQHFKVVS